MHSYRLVFVAPVIASLLAASPVLAQSYYATPQAEPTGQEGANNRAAIARAQQRLRQEEEARRRESVRFTDPRAGESEPLYRGSRLTSGANTYSLPLQSRGNRSVLVPQR